MTRRPQGLWDENVKGSVHASLDLCGKASASCQKKQQVSILDQMCCFNASTFSSRKRETEGEILKLSNKRHFEVRSEIRAPGVPLRTPCQRRASCRGLETIACSSAEKIDVPQLCQTDNVIKVMQPWFVVLVRRM